MLEQAIAKTGRVPDAIFSGHVHNYQRFTSTINGRDVPFIVAGAGGYWNLHTMQKDQQGNALQAPYTFPDSGATLERFCADRHGYMRVEVTPQTLKGEYFSVPRPQESWSAPATLVDAFTLDLNTHRLVSPATSVIISGRIRFMFTLRRYEPADLEAVAYLHVYAIQQAGAYLGRGPWDDDVYAIEEAYLNNQGEFLIGEWDGVFVAMGALRRTSAERAEIKRMRIHPDYQGRGFGQLILSELEARARTLGYKTLHLDTSVVQVPAQKLYEKNGYREVGRDIYGGLEVILYEKQLR